MYLFRPKLELGSAGVGAVACASGEELGLTSEVETVGIGTIVVLLGVGVTAEVVLGVASTVLGVGVGVEVNVGDGAGAGGVVLELPKLDP